jgi:hypothetical protein
MLKVIRSKYKNSNSGPTDADKPATTDIVSVFDKPH